MKKLISILTFFVFLMVTSLTFAQDCQYAVTQNEANVYLHLDMLLGEPKAIVFSVQASNDAHIGFFTEENNMGLM